MIKNILILLPLILVFQSCLVSEEVFLYDEDSDEYQALLELEQEQCKASRIFDEMEDSKLFATYGYDVNTCYKITRTIGDSDSETYIKIHQVNDATLTLRHKCSSNCTVTYAEYTVTATDMDNMILAIQNGVCALDKDDRYTSSGLTSNSQMSFSDYRTDKEDDDDEDYIEKNDTFTVKDLADFPLPLVAHSFTRKVTTYDDGEADSDSYTYTISETDEDDCDFGSNTFTTVTLNINTSAYSSDNLDSVPISMSHVSTP